MIRSAYCIGSGAAAEIDIVPAKAFQEVIAVEGKIRCEFCPSTRLKKKQCTHYARLILQDSLSILPMSLAKLATDFYDNNVCNYVRVRRWIGSQWPTKDEAWLDESVKIIAQSKLLYPHGWIDSFTKLNGDALPRVENFYNDLAKKAISTAEYSNSFLRIYEHFNCQIIKRNIIIRD